QRCCRTSRRKRSFGPIAVFSVRPPLVLCEWRLRLLLFQADRGIEERVDEYLTKYIAFDGGECVGFKLKYVSRLLNLVQQWAHDESEGVRIHLSIDEVTVDLEFLMRAWLFRSLPRRLPLSTAMEFILKVEKQK